MGRYPQICLTEVDEQRNYGYGIGDKVYQLHLVVEEETSEEVAGGDVEPALEERGKDDLLLVILRRKGLARRRLPLHFRLGPQEPAIHQCLNLHLSHHRGLPHCLRVQDLRSTSRHFLKTRSFGSKID
jgi:hypothetical protein